MNFLPAFLLGFLGSFHCVGMCGPIALALPGSDNNFKLIFGRTLYNLGRIVSYSILGLLAGILGWGIALSGYQQYFSILLGVLLLVSAILSLFGKKIISTNVQMSYYWLWFKTQFSKILKSNHFFSMLLVGFLNGFLPCGFVYIALVGALATASMQNAISYMFFFGLGTFPIMFITSLAGKFIPLQIRQFITKYSFIIIMAFGSLLIIRGLNLDIPYLSPKVDAKGHHKCH
jgi:uncharacterized protein